MKKIVKKSIPNAVSFAEISDPAIKTKIMLLQENIKLLYLQLSELQDAVIEIQLKKQI